jgi:D-alanyl-D-alanine carboxypeptidase/D-alanyl-D-alanine-endopeptidase (penicillin-binding protein 4)
MRIVYSSICFLLFSHLLLAQDITRKLKAATEAFEKDSQMRHAIYSLYVMDGRSGKVVFDKNSQFGLAPASCQKIITSGAAFELLGSDFRFRTDLGYRGKIENGVLKGDILIIGTGDPTLGSWRFPDTREEFILSKFVNKIKELKVRQINNGIWIDGNEWSTQSIPDGWIWQDIGNYYGAGADRVNWRENQYDLVLRSGSIIGDRVQIVGTVPELANINLKSEVTTAGKGSGDNAYIYLPPGADGGVVRGTIPVEEKKFTISGSIPNPGFQLIHALTRELEKNKIHVPKNDTTDVPPFFDEPEIFSSIYSPTLDTINYWFLRRSINLYGEALMMGIAYEHLRFGSTEKGVALVKEFWAKQGIGKASINIIDGSGLSPQNRITTNALVKVLQYAKRRPWYNSFYLSLPTYNGMKMKSGSIGGARSFAGYHTGKDGKEYIFAIIVNNYDGSGSAIVRKIYKVLDELK